MAKTIKEMAHQYVYEHCDKDKNAITMQCTYEAGANDVLQMLYNTAYKEDWITNPKDGVRRFFEIYKQLKGK